MRLKIPAPVQTWFNSFGSSIKKHPPVKKCEEPIETNPETASPLIVESIQNLCYEIFALPICTIEAVNVAQTICGHIYDLAQCEDSALQLIILDLLPTLIHVYLVLLTTLTSALVDPPSTERVSGSRRQRGHSRLSNTAASTGTGVTISMTTDASLPRARKSLRERLKKTSTSSMEALRRPSLNRTVRQRTRRLLGGLNFPEVPTNANSDVVPPPESVGSNGASSMTSDSVVSARSCTDSSTSEKTISMTANHMSSLAAILEALLIGLYNTYVRRMGSRESSSSTVLSVLPPFARGSVFCGPLAGVTRGEETEGCSLEGFLKRFPTSSDLIAPLMIGKQNSEEHEMTSCNRWRVLRFLCRICIDQVSDLSKWGREALCQLALLLGPRGLREHRVPAACGNETTSITAAALHSHQHQHRGRRWRRFGRPHHSRHHGKQKMVSSVTEAPLSSTPLKNSGYIHRSGRGGRLDIAHITAPLRSVKAARCIGEEKPLTNIGYGPEVLVTGPCDHEDVSNQIGVMPNKNADLDDNDSENDLDLSVSRSPTSSVNNTEGSSGSRSSSCCSSIVEDNASVSTEGDSEDLDDVDDDDFGVLNEENEEENNEYDSPAGAEEQLTRRNDSLHQRPTLFNGLVGSRSNCNTSNTNIDSNSGMNEEEIFTNAKSTLDDAVDETIDRTDQEGADEDEKQEKEVPESNHDEVATENNTPSSAFDALLQHLQPDDSKEVHLEKKSSDELQTASMCKSDSGRGRRSKKKSSKHRRSRRSHFHLHGSGGSDGHVGVSVVTVRIPRLQSFFVLDLLPGLHFTLSTPQARLAASAIDALERRACLELWSNVLLYVNSIRNSKMYVEATNAAAPCQVDKLALTATTALRTLLGFGPEQSNQSNASASTLRAFSQGNSASSSMASSTLIGATMIGETKLESGGDVDYGRQRQEQEQAEEAKAAYMPSKSPITNASFQVVRLEEDIPLVVDGVGRDSPDSGQPGVVKTTIESPTRSSIQRRRGTRSLSPRLTSRSIGKPMCNSCGVITKEESIRDSHNQPTPGFHSKVRGGLRSNRPKDLPNLKVTFVEASDRQQSPVGRAVPLPSPPHSI